MIPLRSTEGVERFPRASLLLCFFLLLVNLIFYWMPTEFFEFGPVSWQEWSRVLRVNVVSALISPSYFKLFVNLLFVWVFSPKLFEKRFRFSAGIVLGFLGVILARESFFRIHADYMGPLPALDAWVGVLLGMSLRSEIWASVTTLVVGLGWIRVFEVPSYVLLFFWFFYLFLGNLFLSSPYSEAPMLYWLPFVGLLWGFLFEILAALFSRKKNI